MEDRNPLEGDEIRAIFNGEDPDEIVIPVNPMLEEVLNFFKCENLMPLVHRINWLASIKEAVGYIPSNIPMDYEELQYLVILHEEHSTKMAYDSYRMKNANNKDTGGSGGTSGDMSGVLTT